MLSLDFHKSHNPPIIQRKKREEPFSIATKASQQVFIASHQICSPSALKTTHPHNLQRESEYPSIRTSQPAESQITHSPLARLEPKSAVTPPTNHRIVNSASYPILSYPSASTSSSPSSKTFWGDKKHTAAAHEVYIITQSRANSKRQLKHRPLELRELKKTIRSTFSPD